MATPLEETHGRLRRADRRGQGARDRRVQLSAPARVDRSLTSERLGLPRYESLPAALQPVRPRGLRGRLEPICVEQASASSTSTASPRGFLTGKYRSAADADGNPARGPRLKKYLNARGSRILDAIGKVAARHEATYAQVALAWLIGRITAPDRVRRRPRPARRYPQGAAAQAFGGGYGDTERRGRLILRRPSRLSAFSLSYHGAHSTRLVSR